MNQIVNRFFKLKEKGVVIKQNSPSKTGKRWRKRNKAAFTRRNIKELGFQSVAHYLASPLWKAIEFAACGTPCEFCGNQAVRALPIEWSIRTLRGLNRRGVAAFCRACYTQAAFTKFNTKRNDCNASSTARTMIIAARNKRRAATGNAAT